MESNNPDHPSGPDDVVVDSTTTTNTSNKIAACLNSRCKSLPNPNNISITSNQQNQYTTPTHADPNTSSLSNAQYYDLKTVDPKDTINTDDSSIKHEIIQMVSEYLNQEGYTQAYTVLQDEANIKQDKRTQQESVINHLCKSILEGDWVEVEKLTTSSAFKKHRAFKFEIYKVQFLEQIGKNEFQKAYSQLTRKLKPLEKYAPNDREFKELCYLLSCNTTNESTLFKNFDEVKARQKLVEETRNLFHAEKSLTNTNDVPHKRLKTLIQQACAYQIEFSRHKSVIKPRIESLLYDFSPFLIPNACKFKMIGHTSNVKSLAFVGLDGRYIVSGSSDSTIKIWETSTGKLLGNLKGHKSRIWDLCSATNGAFIASASADRSVKLWNLERWDIESSSNSLPICETSFKDNLGDVYTCDTHPDQNHIITGGYDKTVRVFDIKTGKSVGKFNGHKLAVSSVTSNQFGNLVISGSKDCSIKAWDVCSGICIKTISSANLGEITSVKVNESGNKLLVAYKNSINRLWDLRMLRTIKIYKGHYNSSKNFIRATFGPTSKLVTGGSEDGKIPMWDIETGELVQKLPAHNGTVYDVVWNNNLSLLASCGDDGMIKTWEYNQNRPISI